MLATCGVAAVPDRLRARRTADGDPHRRGHIELVPAAKRRDLGADDAGRRMAGAVGTGARGRGTAHPVGDGARRQRDRREPDRLRTSSGSRRRPSSSRRAWRNTPGSSRSRTRNRAGQGRDPLRAADPGRARRSGSGSSDVARQVRDAFYGNEVQRLQRGRDEVKVMVRYPEDDRGVRWRASSR